MRRHKRSSHANHERWLVSYADFITLMFAFFVVLYASSETDKRKQAEVAQAINQAFKALGLFQATNVDPRAKSIALSADQPAAPVNIVLGDELSASPTAAVKADFERMRRELESKLSNQIAQHVVALHIGRNGLVISLREAGFYDSGSTDPHPGSMGSIDSIIAIIRPTPYDIRIEGHTDNVPIHTEQFASNWELSTARATRMAKLFIERFDFQPRRLAASGYAEFHPVAGNDTAEGRGQNRRVDIIVLPSVNGVQQTDSAPLLAESANPRDAEGHGASAAKASSKPPGTTRTAAIH
jgi:chemotaxis protein MotB